MTVDQASIDQVRAAFNDEQNAQLSDEDVKRFIIARKMDIPKSISMISSHLEWLDTVLTGSDTLTPRNILNEPDPDEHVYREYFFHSNLGFSKKGNPVYWEKSGVCSQNFVKVIKHIPTTGLVIRHVRQQEYVFRDKCQKATEFYGRPITKQLLVMDLKNLSYSLDTQAMATFRSCLKIDEANYPERLDHCVMINVPWFFTAIWSIIRPWIDPVTTEKFILIGSDFLPTLRNLIDDSQIPVEYGGKRENFGWTYPENREREDTIEQIMAAACSDVVVSAKKSKSLSVKTAAESVDEEEVLEGIPYVEGL